MIYLLHFDTPIAHAKHYMGFTDDLESRLEAHRRGYASDHHRLMVVAAERRIGFQLARTWPGDRKRERQLKKWKMAPRLCPICRAAAKKENPHATT